MNENIIIGRNAIFEALDADRQIDKIIVANGSEGSIKKIIGKAKQKNIDIRFDERKALDRIAGGQNHQGVVAYVSEFEYCTIDDIFEEAQKRQEDPFIIILDGIQDPHNLGAIIRTAECVGAHGIVIPKRRAALVNSTVEKASAGASQYMKVARVGNINNAIEELKQRGVWIASCDMDGEIYHKTNLTGSIAIVIGNEGSGISKLVKENCDFTVSISMRGRINSLNASNAAAVVMYEIRRQRDL